MNLLNLGGLRLDNIYQIRRKCYYSSGWNFLQSKRGLGVFHLWCEIQKVQTDSVFLETFDWLSLLNVNMWCDSHLLISLCLASEETQLWPWLLDRKRFMQQAPKLARTYYLRRTIIFRCRLGKSRLVLDFLSILWILRQRLRLGCEITSFWGTHLK